MGVAKEAAMKRTVLASVTILVLAVGLVALGVAWQGDRDRDDVGTSMMSGSHQNGGHSHGSSGHGAVVSEAEYLVEMVAHHEDAIEAASQLTRSERPQMRALGARIVASQTAQVTQMTAWLGEWYADAPVADYEPMMRDLSDLAGDRLDRVFLRDMVGHHMMAVMTSQQLLNRGLGDHDEVAELARTVRVEQRAEIRMMTRWSSAWFGVGPRMGMRH